jgi:hypothetical protein
MFAPDGDEARIIVEVERIQGRAKYNACMLLAAGTPFPKCPIGPGTKNTVNPLGPAQARDRTFVTGTELCAVGIPATPQPKPAVAVPPNQARSIW